MSKAWPLVSLGELLRLERRPVKVVPEGQYAEIGIYCFGRGIFHKSPRSGFEVGNKGLFLIKDGDFILQVTFAWEGAVALASTTEDGMFGSTRFPTFRVDESRCHPLYLLNYFKTKEGREQLIKISPGSAGRNRVLSLKRLPEVFIPLPPLSEQRRIVAKIEEIASKIEKAQELRRQSLEEAESLFASASKAAFKKQPSWTEARVSDFCEHPQYGYTASATMESIGPRLLRITDIQNGQVNWDTVPFCQCPNPKPYLLQKNDLLFARTGATTGKSFLIRERPEAVFASYLIRLRVKQLVIVEYLYKYFQTPLYWTQIIGEKKGTGQPNVNGKKLANILVPIAPPQEQNRIVTYLDNLQSKVDELKRFQAETQKELDALIPSILDKAFKGEL